MFTNLLAPIVGADWASLLATIIWIIIAVAVLMIAWKLYLAFSGGINLLGGRGRDVRLAIIDAAPIDQKRRIVLVRRDGVEHLIMIGGPNDVVIEQGISAPIKAAVPKEAPASSVKRAAPAAPVASAAPPSKAVAAETDPLDDFDLEEDDMFDSLIADRVAAAKKTQAPVDIPPAPIPAAAPAVAPKPAPPVKSTPPQVQKPVPPVAPAPAVPKPTAPLVKEAPVAPKAPTNDISLEDEMQALIRDLQTK